MTGHKNNLYSFSFIIAILVSTGMQECTAPLHKNMKLSYDISHPTKIIELRKKLVEVSGLSYISDNEVALIQDEDGTIFFYNMQQKAISRKVFFAKDGDYEDLNVIGDTAYVLRSDGLLYEIANLQGKSKDMVVIKHKTGLTQKNDTEGVCYDALNNQLLIACKGSPGTEDKYKGKKAIYGFNLSTKQLSAEPVALIDISDVDNLAYGTGQNVIDKFVKFFRKTKQNPFNPSGLAIHPLTRDIYMVSSVGNMLVVVDSTGTLINAKRLPTAKFKQPEGIAFDPLGNMYISNEGRNGNGNILKFMYEKK